MMAAGLIIGKWDALPVAATFLYDLAQVPVNWFVAHTWSLAVEEQFYLVFPILWVLTPARWRSGAVAATFLLCIVWSLAYGYSATSIQIGPIPRWGFAAISVGVWAAINERWVRQAAARVPAFCIGLVALLLIIRPVHTDAHFAYQSFNAAVLPLGIGLVLMYSLERGRWLRAALCSKPMQAVGVTSYGIYLWQQTFTGPTADYTSRGAPIGFMLPLLLIVIPASYFFLEKPAMRFGKTLSQRVREKASAKAGASA
jgi:peptidoglycan/LPS O-acetylase OafA/YrhL